MTTGKNSLQYNGKEYVTVLEFSQRFGVTKQSILNAIKSNVLQAEHLNGNRTFYFDWEVQKLNYLRYIKAKKKKGRKTKSKIDKDTVFNLPQVPKIREDSNSIDTPEAPGIPDMPKNIINISTLNPNDYPDCWLKDDLGEPILNSITHEPELDYDRLKQRLTAEKYQLDIAQKRGEFIERNELTRSIISIANIINAGLAAIPQRYGAILIAEAERLSGHEFSADERAVIRNVLKGEAANIMNSIRTEIDNMTDGAEDDSEKE